MTPTVTNSGMLLIDGAWRPATGGDTLAVENPATEETVATVASASQVCTP